MEIDGDGSGALPRLNRVPEQRLSIPLISPSVAAALQNFSWISDGDGGGDRWRWLRGTSPSQQGAGTETFYPANLPFGGGGAAELFVDF